MTSTMKNGSSPKGYDDLLSKLGTIKVPTEKQEKSIFPYHQIVRKCTSYKKRNFSHQYCHSYTKRLCQLRPRLAKKVEEEWSNQKVQLKKISELCENTRPTLSPQKGSKPSPMKNDYESHEQRVTFQGDITVAIIGTIFKQQPEKPSILQDLSEENPMIPVIPKQSYISDKDYLILEDETSRVRLNLAPDCGFTIHQVVNGIVCAVKGKPTVGGKFEVHDVMWATPKQAVLPNINPCFDFEMIFVSGLHVGKPDSEKNDVFIDLFFEYLAGLVGSLEEQTEKISNQTRVFFIGNTLRKSDSNSSSVDENLITYAKKLDSTLMELAKTMEVFMFPGQTDPGEIMLPQPPIHRCIFPKASQLTTFHSLSNPTRLKLGISKTKDENLLDVIFSSGENVLDGMKNSNIICPLEMSKCLLQWGHICPTAPDTLPLQPGCEVDDLIIEDYLPHIFIVGNQKEFGTLDWGTTKIVSIPDFSKTGCAVVLTKDMNFIPLQFDIDF